MTYPITKIKSAIKQTVPVKILNKGTLNRERISEEPVKKYTVSVTVIFAIEPISCNKQTSFVVSY